MNPTAPHDLMSPILAALALYATDPSPYARPVRIRVRGRREGTYVWMAGGGSGPGIPESSEEVDALMRERKAVEI